MKKHTTPRALPQRSDRVMSAAGFLMWERSGTGFGGRSGGNGETTTREDG